MNITVTLPTMEFQMRHCDPLLARWIQEVGGLRNPARSSPIEVLATKAQWVDLARKLKHRLSDAVGCDFTGYRYAWPEAGASHFWDGRQYSTVWSFDLFTLGLHDGQLRNVSYAKVYTPTIWHWAQAYAHAERFRHAVRTLQEAA